MLRTIVSVERINHGHALCVLDDGSRYSIRGTKSQVDNQLAKYEDEGLELNAQDTVKPTMDYVLSNLSRLERERNAQPAFKGYAVEDDDPSDMIPPTINFKTGEIERNGKPIVEQPVIRESPLAFMFLQNAGPVANEGSELNEEPYLPPTMDFSDRLVTHQPGRPIERQLSIAPNYIANGSEENEPPMLPPTMDFSDRAVRR